MAKSLEDVLGKRNLDINPQKAKASKAIETEILAKLSEISQDNSQAVALLDQLQADRSSLTFLANIFSLSPYLRDCALIRADILAECLSAPFDKVLPDIVKNTAESWRDGVSQTEFMTGLRIAKRKISLALGVADLGRWLEPSAVTRILSEFADAALSATVNYLLVELHNSGKVVLADLQNPSSGSGVIVLGMGKFGAFELNYSSDIDIILFFDLSQKMQLSSDDPTTVFVRFAKQLSRILQERTGDGYVFRVDLRLRPDPGSTPLAIPVETAFNYYEAYGQNWERAAFIKARAVAGDIDCGNDFLRGLAPFVWRKYLDFAAIQDVHSIKRQIHAHKGHGEIAVKGHNVKLGRGGIREIEFFVQTQQLIAGGRRPQLRTTGTIEGLNALCVDGWITADAAAELTDAYWFLRNVEHRIQMISDEQSHTLPEDEEGLNRIALMMGHKDHNDFAERLVTKMRIVGRHYAALFEATPELAAKGGNLVFTGDDDDPGTLETISNMGFQQPSQIISTIKGWHYGRYNAVRTAPAREMLTEITPTLLEAFSETTNPDLSFFAFDRFLSGLPAGIQFFSILKSNANLIRLITLILGSAPRLAEIITRKPHIFDGLIDPSFTASIPDKDELSVRLSNALDRAPSYEEKLDQARIFAAEQRFLIGIRLINRTINARQAGIAYSRLAEVVLELLTDVVRYAFEQKHGVIEGGQIGVLGMGRLGSYDLTASSDLDLIFLYDHHEDAEASNGEKPLYPQQYFIRLVQRLITAMNAPTAEGTLYELDFRLRPSGNSGPLATHIQSFVKYQNEEAWIWESQAIVRARTIIGDGEIVGKIEDELSKIRGVERNRVKVTKEILDMRKTLDKEKPASNLFDVKRAQGGLVDIEFIGQWAVLTDSVEFPSNYDSSTMALIENTRDAELNLADKETLKNAYEYFNAILQIQRVCLDSGFDPDAEDKGFAAVLTEQVSSPDLKNLMAQLKDTQKEVRAIFTKVMSK